MILRRTALALVGLGLALTAGCSSGPAADVKTVADTQVTSRVQTPFTVVTEATTTTTVAVATPTTTCRLVSTGGSLQTDPTRLDSLVGGRRTAESGVAQIQLTIDNAGRQIEQYRRTQTDAQKTYDQAVAAYNILGTDTANDKMTAAADNLADWKGIVASWEALRTKALGDLARGKATLADWDKQITAARRVVTTPAQDTLTCS